MRTINFSRHNALLCTEDCSSLDIPDAMSCRAHYTVERKHGKALANIWHVERETKNDIWVHDDLPTLERQALEAHIERLFDEDDAEDARNVREVASGYV
jgi:hypothetical protein